MNREETLYVMATLREAYPSFYARSSAEDLEPAVRLWQECFEDDPIDLVLSAVKAVIISRDDTYPPAIGTVKAKIRTLTEPEGMSENAAWALVSKACAGSSQGYAANFAALPPEIQKIVGSPDMLRKWGAMEEADVQTVVASNFQRSFRTSQQRQREYAALPRALRETLQKLTDGFARKECLPSNTAMLSKGSQ